MVDIKKLKMQRELDRVERFLIPAPERWISEFKDSMVHWVNSTTDRAKERNPLLK